MRTQVKSSSVGAGWTDFLAAIELFVAVLSLAAGWSDLAAEADWLVCLTVCRSQFGLKMDVFVMGYEKITQAGNLPRSLRSR